MSSDSLQKTPLNQCHIDAGAKLAPFAGWEMPIQYSGVGDEHLATRASAGIFDVSHMGEIETAGPDATELLQLLLSNDVAAMPIGGAQYSLLCREDGGILDDLFTYRLESDRYLTVTNAANHAADLAWFRRAASAFDCDVRDRAADYAMIAVQGPDARQIVSPLFAGALPKRMTAKTVPGAVEEIDAALICGTGYTGEDGVEILIDPTAAPSLWELLRSRGATPAGLAARDTLRTEVCFHLYGNDLSTSRNPIEAGLGWCCKEDTEFIGHEAVAASRSAGPTRKFAAFALTAPGVPRPGGTVHADGTEVGEVTSGTYSPSMRCGIGLAYVEARLANPGTPVEIETRGKFRPAEIRDRPLYKKG